MSIAVDGLQTSPARGLSPVATYSALPVASGRYAGLSCYVTGLDATYQCTQTGSSTYAWKVVAYGPMDPLDGSDLLYWALNDAAAPAANSGTSGPAYPLATGAGSPSYGVTAAPFGGGTETAVTMSGVTLSVGGAAGNTPGVNLIASAWVKIKPTATYGSIIQRTNGAGNSPIWMLSDVTSGSGQDGLDFWTYVGGVLKQVTISGSASFYNFRPNTWVFLTWAMQSHTLYGYLNGTLLGSLACGGDPDLDSGGTWRIGDDGSSQPLAGSVYGVRIRSAAYSASDLTAWARRQYFRGIGVWNGVP